MTTSEVSRVAVTPAAAGLLRELYAAHGPLMFHQSGGGRGHRDSRYLGGGHGLVLRRSPSVWVSS